MGNDDPYEDQLSAVFDPTKWLGRGKLYKDVPLHVCLARYEVLTPPPDILAHFPSPDMPILDFITFKLPTLQVSYSLNTYKTDAWFSRNSPTTSTTEAWDIISRRPIPSRAILDSLDNAFGQQWFNGAKSIVDPRYKNTFRLPLWVLGLWRRISTIVGIQAEWINCKVFVEKAIRDPIVSSHYPTVASVLGARAWNTEVAYGGNAFPTHKFGLLLQDRQLCDDIAQSMVAFLQHRLTENEDLQAQHCLAASRFYKVLEVAAKGNRYSDGRLPSSLKYVEDLIRINPSLKLWIPVLHRSHEVAVLVNFQTKTIEYGMHVPEILGV